MNKLKDYYLLTKPGIIRGNVMTAIAGFFFASQGVFDWLLLFAVITGVSLVIASGCVFNNYIDRGIDAVMSRTKNRALVAGRISGRSALIYGSTLGIAGFGLLALYTNYLVVMIGIVGIIDYVVLYGYSKRKSVHSTLIGGISGSTSLVAGYVSVTGRIDIVAILLFVIMAFWQMPHFFAIGIYKYKDYKAAKLPILSVSKGVETAKRQTVIYITGTIVSSLLLTIFGHASIVLGLVLGAIGLWWIIVAVSGLNSSGNDIKWGHKIFGISLIFLMAFSVLLTFDWLLP